nr:MAG TPA: hypothetical protein [Caudoviricetes sp.]
MINALTGMNENYQCRKYVVYVVVWTMLSCKVPVGRGHAYAAPFGSIGRFGFRAALFPANECHFDFSPTPC